MYYYVIKIWEFLIEMIGSCIYMGPFLLNWSFPVKEKNMATFFCAQAWLNPTFSYF